ncbi:Bcsps19 [Botrytis cinerea B05.10]|uniref:2,4-dienoyl-CoA reductase [(3E)-enoyl-CoA-producing] n=3 Tax=Botryotinia fuckeliana TaxID=40559 RepID=A0A384J6H3_BOTFB|nr:Bcsps19 [Botrytis cinerea B05.10]ATZ46139.1 Bcsps19 [Botrytis cinerea B05.10]EMR84222.1 putative sporulation protein sps19 protein [Botrytis cinerea BcDW1]CCD45858.1 similar to peroxisomal 2,4-dienoyl-CoA reductase SPS19 [Botrytis cinerea T4]
MALPRSEYLSDVWRNGIFDNKVVFCTGGAGTICSAQVRAMVHLGANACIIGRNPSKTESMAKSISTARPGSKVIGIGGVDVRNIKSLDSAVETCVKELGGIDFVIAGAAGNFISPLEGLSSNAFRTVLEIDTLGSFNTLKATLPHLIKSASAHPNKASNPNTGGRIIFISATFHFTGMALQGHAAAAKAGVDAISATAALEYGPRGITSNVITPGPIEGTEGMARLGDKESEASGDAQRRNPLGRYGTVKEIADGTVYLFSDAGSFVNGEVLVIDGGNWRHPGGMAGGKRYPDYLLDDTFVRRKESKL